MRFRIWAGLVLVIAAALVVLPCFGPKAYAGGSGKVVSITVPNPCVVVNRVEGDKVFLLSGGVCAQVISKIQVSVPSSVTRVTIYLDGTIWHTEDIEGKGGR